MKNVIIVILVIALAICISLLVKDQHKDEHGFITGYANKTAREYIKRYRTPWLGSVYKKTNVILYDTSDIDKYLRNDFCRITTEIRLQDGYRWATGFYFMEILNKQGEPRTGIFVIPTMVCKSDSTKFLDFYDNPWIYRRWYHKSDDNDDDDITAFDAGHMYP